MKWLSLLRVFFPSWRFFVVSGLEPLLQVRCSVDSPTLSEWTLCTPPIRRSIQFLNPQGNYIHACHNLLLNFTREISEQSWSDEDVLNSAQYQIVHNIVLLHLRSVSTPHTHYQFRICFHDPTGRTEPQVTLQSPVYGAQQ